MGDVTRFDDLNLAPVSLLVARPVGTMVRNVLDNLFYYSTNSAAPAYTVLGSDGGGGVTGIKQRVDLALLQANASDATTSIGLFAESIPAHSLVVGAALYVTTAPVGVGVTASKVTCTGSNVGALSLLNGIELEDVFGLTPGYIQTLNGNQDLGVSNTRVIIPDVDSPPVWQINNTGGDIATMTAFDVTIYWFYQMPFGITLP